jgi:hypothetical protein
MTVKTTNTKANTRGRNVSSEIAYLTRALKVVVESRWMQTFQFAKKETGLTTTTAVTLIEGSGRDRGGRFIEMIGTSPVWRICLSVSLA